MARVDRALEGAPRIASPALLISLGACIDRLLGVLIDATPDAESSTRDRFRSSLTAFRTRLESAHESAEVTAAAAECVAMCDTYLRRSNQYQTQRESEFLELIEVLRDAARHMGRTGLSFSADVLSRTDRLSSVSQLEDVRELRRQISEEVADLRRAAEQKQAADQQFADSLATRVEVLQATLVKVEREAASDPLTRVANRGSFDRLLPKMIAAARAQGTSLTLALIDVDDFKTINDTYGHPVGDRVLVCAAEAFVAGVRLTDVVARYGGDEFAIILERMRLDLAVTRFDALLKRIGGQDYLYQTEPDRQTLKFTVSCGVAELSADDTDATLVARADRALYTAKQKGKNRTAGRSHSRLQSLLGRS